MATYDDTVFPGKNGKFIKTSNQIPTGSDVASDEDAERQNRKGVHRSAIPRGSTCRPLVKAKRIGYKVYLCQAAVVGLLAGRDEATDGQIEGASE